LAIEEKKLIPITGNHKAILIILGLANAIELVVFIRTVRLFFLLLLLRLDHIPLLTRHG
jgi:hypothetical protein